MRHSTLSLEGPAVVLTGGARSNVLNPVRPTVPPYGTSRAWRLLRLLPFLCLLAGCWDTDTFAPGQGRLRVSVTMAGLDFDPNSVQVFVDGSLPVVLAAGDTTIELDAGNHTVQLTGLFDNCVVEGGTSRQVLVRQGETTNVAFAVTCGAATGAIEVTVRTTGTDPDADGYLVRVDGAPQRVVDGTTVRFAPIAAGLHAVHLEDLAGNCAVGGENPVTVSVTVGGAGRDTARVQFYVACTQPAVLRVTAPTTGPDPDPDYRVRVDGGESHPLAAKDTLSLKLTPGAHSIELTDFAPNCTVGVPNPATVDVSTEAPTDLAFPVTCTALPPTGLGITITTTGNDRDTSYELVICFDEYCYRTAYRSVVPADTVVRVDLPPGYYNVSLIDVADNCRESWNGDPMVTAGQVTAVRIDVTCVFRADFVAGVTVTGTDVDSSFYLAVDGGRWIPITPGSPVTVTSLEGEHAINLGGITPNCKATSPNPVTVTLVTGVLTPISFAVDCAPLPVIRVTVSTTGANIPAGYQVGIDPDDYYGYSVLAAVGANGTVSLKVWAGRHEVWLDQVPANCTLSGTNGVVVSPGYGETAEVAFTVACQ